MQLNSLNDLYLAELKDSYDAEGQLVEALPKLAESATSRELRKAFTNHLKQTKGHVKRLEKVFKNLGVPAKGKTCKGMKGLISEGEEMLKARGDDDTRDAALISSAQRVEHYEIAAYGTVVAYARALNRPDDVRLLEETLNEEKEADQLLNQIALNSVNLEALAGQNGRPRGNGRAPSSREATRGNGKAAAGAVREMTQEELYEKAREMDIPGRSKMNKKQLARAVGR